jgi:hypothetical protein
LIGWSAAVIVLLTISRQVYTVVVKGAVVWINFAASSQLRSQQKRQTFSA